MIEKEAEIKTYIINDYGRNLLTELIVEKDKKIKDLKKIVNAFMINLDDKNEELADLQGAYDIDMGEIAGFKKYFNSPALLKDYLETTKKEIERLNNLLGTNQNNGLMEEIRKLREENEKLKKPCYFNGVDNCWVPNKLKEIVKKIQKDGRGHKCERILKTFGL